MKRTLCLLMLFFALFALPQIAFAQIPPQFVYSISHVQQFGDPADPNSVMAGYGVMGMTYHAAVFYNSLNVVSLYKDGQLVDQQPSENYPYTAAFSQAPLQAGSVYTQFNDSGVRLVVIQPCGIRYDWLGLINIAYSPFEGDTRWDPYPSICIVQQILYLGYTAAQQQATQANVKCQETCRPCKRDRRNKIIICAGAFTVCESAFFFAYQNALLACDNSPVCQIGNPAFNQQQCDNCKDMAENNFKSQAISCAGGSAAACFFALPDCSQKVSCPNGDMGDPAPCN
jgi:hypothetical protein